MKSFKEKERKAMKEGEMGIVEEKFAENRKIIDLGISTKCQEERMVLY